MTTIPSPALLHQPVMPLPMPTYAYRYPNSDSRPYVSLPEHVGIYNKTLPGTYQWETHNPDRTRDLTYIGPDWFKEPPKHYALASNFPKENYSPTMFARNNDAPGRLLSSKGYVPHFTNKTNASWSRFLNETPERFNVGSSTNHEKVVDLPRFGSAPPATAGTLDSLTSVNSGIGADFTQRPVMALSSQYRNNDGNKYSSYFSATPWRPYGNSPAYFKTYIQGYPKM